MTDNTPARVIGVDVRTLAGRGVVVRPAGGAEPGTAVRDDPHAGEPPRKRTAGPGRPEGTAQAVAA